jgi:co-chaperonin GroES (HSP10)
VNLRPLGDRILIKPEIPPNVTESGLILQEDRKPEQTGTVIAVGPCPHPRKQEAEELASALDGCENIPTPCAICGGDNDGWHLDQPHMFEPSVEFKRTADLLRDLVRKEPEVKVGDYVVFSWTSGQEIWLEDGEARYLLMRESDILCVVEGLEA